MQSASASRLAAALAREIEGEVRFDDGSRALYATDASNYRQVPIGVVVPRTEADVVKTVALCRDHGAPVLPRGGGTSLCGQCCNEAVVLDFSKYLNRILELDPARKRARVQPGVVLDDLRKAARRHGLTFAPDPATHNHNTLGGMIGNNSCGPHSVMGGNTVDNVLALEVLTYRGERLRVASDSRPEDHPLFQRLHELGARHAEEIRARYPGIPRRVSGYNLGALLPGRFELPRALVGTEGTCVVVLEADLRLVDAPPEVALLVLGYDSVFDAAADVPRVMSHGPVALEGMDDLLVQDMRALGMHPEKVGLLPDGHGWLIAEFGADTLEAAVHKARTAAEGHGACRIFDAPEEQHLIWKVRESGLGATAHVPNKPLTWEGWEDSAVPPERLAEYLRKLRALYDEYGFQGDLYGHFGQGCVHTRIDFDLRSAEGIARFRRFLHDAARLVTSLGGSISGEHGDGQSKAEVLETMFGPTLIGAFREFKAIWDPDGMMNPGKVVDAYRAHENLRLGTSYDPPPVAVHFHYRDDAGDFSRAMLRCVGVGECRKKDGTMCPSYMATGEEMHSTRGRARLLWEMLNADTLKQGWKSPAVKEALDLCLSCKGCKRECPVKVDMATYKAEFLAHYYGGRLRPLKAYAFGMIDRWAALGTHLPGLSNFAANLGVSKWLLDVAPEREVTRFAPRAFTAAYRPRGEGMDVILWPDTFNNYFNPEVAHAAAAALEAAGCRVRVPPRRLCCGRPLYEQGMVERARRYLGRVLETLGPDIRAGVPVVGLEPACVSVFREELLELFPFDEQAKRLAAQTMLLADFLAERAPRFPFRREGRALVHGHCHQQSVLGMEGEMAVLERLGLEAELLDSGCCGMAGSFGFEREKYAVSMRCAERVLAPAVRAAAPETVLVAGGFSCREQVAHATGRRPLHLAQVLNSGSGS
ncbi:MAG TPA: FAD-binding and (Fe-S)-binding domain-containing protein [Burkholderiales bacterium]|nr:FAD-binding and (Fe-S)-binding domain-containing protein [Burkholderiales bacterium]